MQQKAKLTLLVAIIGLLIVNKASSQDWGSFMLEKPSQHTLYYDEPNNRVGINTNSPTVDLEVYNTISATNLFARTISVSHIDFSEETIQALQDIMDDEIQAKADWPHQHPISEVDGLQTALDNKAELTALNNYVLGTVYSAGLLTKANVSHTHIISDTSGLQAVLDDKISTSTYITGLLTKANVSHTHVISDVTGLAATLAALPTSSSLALKSDKSAFVSATALSGTTVSGTVANAPNDAPTGLSALLLLGAAIGELNATNVRQNTIANKVNEIAVKLNLLVSDVNVNVSKTNLIKNAGAGI